MSELLSVINQSLQELQRMHELNFELLEQLNVVCEWIVKNDIQIPNREKLNSLLSKTKALADELYFSSPQVIRYRKLSTDFTQGNESTDKYTVPR